MPLQDFLAGIVGGFAGKICEYPFDSIKTRLQVQDALVSEAAEGVARPGANVGVNGGGGRVAATAPVGHSGPSMAEHVLPKRRIYTGAWDCFTTTLRHEGVRGLYQGMSLPLAGTVLETAVLFAANGAVKKILARGRSDEELKMWEVLSAGAFTGLIVSHILTPIELIKCRLQVQDASAREFESPLACIRHALRTEGPGVFFKGHLGTVLREVPGTACWFGAYEAFIRTMSTPGVSREDLPAPTIVAAGALGGMAYWTAFFPADVAKSQVQVSRCATTPSVVSIMRRTYATSGVRGLYRGLGPTLLRAAPANAAVFLCYEYTSRFLRQLF